jgi:predicted metal-binding membrane protein
VLPQASHQALQKVKDLGFCAGLMLALFALDPMSIVWTLVVSALIRADGASRPAPRLGFRGAQVGSRG